MMLDYTECQKIDAVPEDFRGAEKMQHDPGVIGTWGCTMHIASVPQETYTRIRVTSYPQGITLEAWQVKNDGSHDCSSAIIPPEQFNRLEELIHILQSTMNNYTRYKHNKPISDIGQTKERFIVVKGEKNNEKLDNQR